MSAESISSTRRIRKCRQKYEDEYYVTFKKRRTCEKSKKSKEESETSAQHIITNVNNDCLEHAFKYLNYTDLLNVVDSSKQLIEAANLAFVSKFGRKTVVLNSFRFPIKQSVSVHPEDIWIFDFPTCLKTLRCFGKYIRKLHVYYNFKGDMQRIRLENYITKYCAATVTEIKFCHAPSNSMKHLKKLKFPKAETVIFENIHCELDANLSNLKKCFPNVRRLELINCDESLSKSISVHLAKMEHLTLDIQMKNICSTQKKWLSCLPLNPQLRDLRISGDFHGNFLRSLSKDIAQQTESLCINVHPKCVASFEGSPIVFKDVTSFHMQSDYALQDIQSPLLFEKLEKLTLEFTELRVNRNIVDFIRNQKSLRTFICNCNTVNMDEENKENLIDALQSMEAVYLKCCTFSIREAIDFLGKCKSLKEIGFKLSCQSGFNILQKDLNDEWSGHVDNIGYVELKRRTV